MILIIIFGNALLKLFYDKLGIPYIKLNINQQKISCYGYILLLD